MWVKDFNNEDILTWFCGRDGYTTDLVTGMANYPLCAIERDDSCGSCGAAAKYWEQRA